MPWHSIYTHIHIYGIAYITIQAEGEHIGHTLTHWGQDQTATISQTTYSNVISLMKMYEFRLEFHWGLFPRFELTVFQHRFRYWLGADQATSNYLNQWWLVYLGVYASLGLNELNIHPHGTILPQITPSKQFRPKEGAFHINTPTLISTRTCKSVKN